MNLDPFGHIAVARHFLSEKRRMLALTKQPSVRKILTDSIAESETRIARMEQNEVDYWQRMQVTP